MFGLDYQLIDPSHYLFLLVLMGTAIFVGSLRFIFIVKGHNKVFSAKDSIVSNAKYKVHYLPRNASEDEPTSIDSNEMQEIA